MPGIATWNERAFDGARASALEAAGQSAVMSRLLASRGVEAANLDRFFDPSLGDLADPAALPGINEAVEKIMPFLSGERKVVVFGDYDADGVCASAILVSALSRLGADVKEFIPRRNDEGYGMTAASLERLFAEHPGVSLVITVDNGISSPAEVASLRERGVTVVVTDHHLPGAELPVADALVNPRIASAPGCEDLCGAGVAFFLASALAKAATAAGIYSGPKFGGPLLVLAGLATVADLMPLVGQNRVLVAQSLLNFQRCAPVGLRELYLRASRKTTGPILARDYSFTLVPRINAAGRMSSAVEAYHLVTCENREEARWLAMNVDALNAMRKTIEQRMDREARMQIDDSSPRSAVVVRGDDWHLGVAGIVAARLLETYRVPVAVAVGDTGSARAPDGYNVHRALEESSAHLVRFGGHAAAGGFTVLPGDFEGFKAAFSAACAGQRADAGDCAAIAFDGWLEPKDLTLDLYNDMQRLEPFGECNPEPVFGLAGVAFSEVRPVGADGRHAAFAFVNRAIPRAVWWGHGRDVEYLRAKSSARFDVLFTLAVSDYGGEPPHLELRLAALRPAAAQ